MRCILHGWHGIEDGEDLRSRAKRALDHDVKLTERFDRLVEDKNSGNEAEESAGCQIRSVDIEKRETNTEGGNDFYDGADRFRSLDHPHSVGELLLRAAAK